MSCTVKEAADLAGVSVCTLHYYDEIGLLRPSKVSPAGYRYYDDAAMAQLHRILIYRELEMPLKEVARMLSCPKDEKLQTLTAHRERLLFKRRRLDALIALVDEMTGGDDMDKKQTTLKRIRDTQRAYADEAQQKWGDSEAWRESNRRHAGYTDEQEIAIAHEADEIFRALAASMDKSPKDPAVLALVARWQQHITQRHYLCDTGILAGLGQMYVADERFTEHIDRFGDGLAAFFSEAIACYCEQKQAQEL